MDGGNTWHPATGRESWSYSWIPQASGTVNIRARAVDDSGNFGSCGCRHQCHRRTGRAASNCPCSIWNNATTPSSHQRFRYRSSRTWCEVPGLDRTATSRRSASTRVPRTQALTREPYGLAQARRSQRSPSRMKQPRAGNNSRSHSPFRSPRAPRTSLRITPTSAGTQQMLPTSLERGVHERTPAGSRGRGRRTERRVYLRSERIPDERLQRDELLGRCRLQSDGQRPAPPPT